MSEPILPIRSSCEAKEQHECGMHHTGFWFFTISSLLRWAKKAEIKLHQVDCAMTGSYTGTFTDPCSGGRYAITIRPISPEAVSSAVRKSLEKEGLTSDKLCDNSTGEVKS